MPSLTRPIDEGDPALPAGFIGYLNSCDYNRNPIAPYVVDLTQTPIAIDTGAVRLTADPTSDDADTPTPDETFIIPISNGNKATDRFALRWTGIDHRLADFYTRLAGVATINIQRAIVDSLTDGFTPLTVLRSRISPSIAQVNRIKTVSVDGVNPHGSEYMNAASLDPQTIAKQLLIDTDFRLSYPPSYFRDGNGKIIKVAALPDNIKEKLSIPTSLSRQDVYRILRAATRSQFRATPFLYFLRSVQKEILRQTAAMLGEDNPANLIERAITEEAFCLPLPEHDEYVDGVIDRLAKVGRPIHIKEIESDGKRVRQTNAAGIFALAQVAHKNAVFHSVHLQLYEVLANAMTYQFFDHTFDNITLVDFQDSDTTKLNRFVGTLSAWPDEVVLAVDRQSLWWRQFADRVNRLAGRDEQIADDSLACELVIDFFSGHMHNLKDYTLEQLEIFYEFLQGISSGNGQIVLVENKLKTMKESANINAAQFDLTDSALQIAVEQSQDNETDDVGVKDNATAIRSLRQLHLALSRLLNRGDYTELPLDIFISLGTQMIWPTIIEEETPQNRYWYDLTLADKYDLRIYKHTEQELRDALQETELTVRRVALAHIAKAQLSGKTHKTKKAA